MSRSPPRSPDAVTPVEVDLDMERVARALYEHDALRTTARRKPWDLATTDHKTAYLARAAAAIEALRTYAAADNHQSPIEALDERRGWQRSSDR